MQISEDSFVSNQNGAAPFLPLISQNDSQEPPANNFSLATTGCQVVTNQSLGLCDWV